MAQNLDPRRVLISDPGTLGAGAKTTSRIQNKEVYATLCLQATKLAKKQRERASGAHLDLSRAPYDLYGVKYIDLVSLWECCPNS